MPEDGLETALASVRDQREEHVPVVEGRQTLQMMGEVRYRDLVPAADRALLAARAAERG